MSLLREIQNAAIDSTVPLTSLLRKCKVLSARLGNEGFKNWIDNELNGYKSKDELPPYRVFTVHSKGHFSGSFQSGLRNADIPMTCMPKKFRESLSHSYMMSPVAGLEALVNSSDGGILSEPWNPDIVAHFGGNIYEDMHCVQAWKVIPTSAVISALDTIRTRILNFVLEIEAEAPEAGEAATNSNPVPQDRVQQIFNTYITGNVQNVANASPGANLNATYNEQNPELFRDLIQAINTSGIERSIAAAAIESTNAMANATSRDSFRAAYLQFMSLLADHMQVIGVAISPFLPALTALLG